MPSKARRPDLAAMLAPLIRELIAAELPVLNTHGLSMWGYSVLLALDDSPMRTQAALAEAIGADKTRIIPTLDDLQAKGHIERRPDPDDRIGSRREGHGAGGHPARRGALAIGALGQRPSTVPARTAGNDARQRRP